MKRGENKILIEEKIEKIYHKIKGFRIKEKPMKDTSLKYLKNYEVEEELQNHMLRVSEYAELLADLLCLDKKKINQIKRGALLHDLGKKLIDNNILNKNIKLTLEEFEIIKKHCKLGLKILNKKDENYITENIILLHHEKWNGKGYPFGLDRKNIPLEARIVSIVDCYDALTTDRVYKTKVSHEKAIEILKDESGKSFDPDMVSMVEIFENRFKRLLEKFKSNKRL